MKHPSITLLALGLLLTANVAVAQSTTDNSSLSLTIGAYAILDDALALADLDLGASLAPGADTPVLFGTAVTQNVRVLTNSSAGARLHLAVASSSSGPGLNSAWDNMKIHIDGTQTTEANAVAGSSPGTIADLVCTGNGDCANNIVSGIKGGQYNYAIRFQSELTSRFALAGARSFSATYTVFPN